MKLSKELKAGIIAILAIVGFVFVFQFMKGKNMFSRDNIYYAKFQDVEGVSASSPISINGLKVGQVSAITPITDDKGNISFVLKLLVDKKYHFSKNSTVEVYETGLMSGTGVKINYKTQLPYAQEGDTLMGHSQMTLMKNIASQVGPVKDQLQTVLKTIDSLGNNANKVLDKQNREEIKALLINLNKTVASFETTSKQTNSLLASSNPKLQKVLDNANLATISAKNTIDGYGKVADQIDTRSLNQTIQKLGNVTDNLNKLVSGIEEGKGSLGKLTKDDELYRNLNQTVANMNALVTDLKANPKRYINISVFGKSEKPLEKN